MHWFCQMTYNALDSSINYCRKNRFFRTLRYSVEPKSFTKMKKLYNILNWRTTNVFISVVLLALIVLNFYGVYTNRFYFAKPTNYIFPLLTMTHFVYLYVIWFKIKENELPDPIMRNLEYSVYALAGFYFYRIYDSYLVLNSLTEFQQHLVPSTFEPTSTLILVLYALLAPLTLISFWQRRRLVGSYKFENYNDNLNIWQ